MDLVPRLRMPCSQAFSNSSFTANDPKLETGEGLGAVQSQGNGYLFCGENLLRVFLSRIAYCFSVAGVVREERSKAEKEYFKQLVDAGMFAYHVMRL